MRWFTLTVVSIVTVFAGGACGGESAPKETESKETAVVEERSEEKKQGSDNASSVDCQLDKVEAELGAGGAQEMMDEWYRQEMEPRLVEQDYSSALAEAKDLHTFLAEQGYTC